MANEEIKKPADKADDFLRKLFAGGFRDQEKGITGGHRNPRWKKSKNKITKKDSVAKVFGDQQ
jgi:hypothetical protein